MIGLGIITCERPHFLKQCIDSIPFDRIDHVVLVNDGKDWINDCVPDELKSKIYCIQHTAKPRQGVAISKNQALSYLLEKGCEDLFLIEDDIIIKEPEVFDAYINASRETGIHHLMFGYHGPANKTASGGEPKPRRIYHYKETDIAINEHCVGAFCYYTRECLSVCGLMDTRFYNAFEHVEHSYKLALKGYSTPYWNWADIANSCDFLGELACSENNSSIRGHEGWSENIQKGMKLFQNIHGKSPFGPCCVPDTPEEELKVVLKKIYEEHSCWD